MNTFNLLKSGASFSKSNNQKLLKIFNQKPEEKKTSKMKDNFENVPIDTELARIDGMIEECKEKIKKGGSKEENEAALKSL